MNKQPDNIYSYAHSGIPADAWESECRRNADILATLLDLLRASQRHPDGLANGPESARKAVLALLARHRTLIWPDVCLAAVIGKEATGGAIWIDTQTGGKQGRPNFNDFSLNLVLDSDGDDALRLTNIHELLTALQKPIGEQEDAVNKLDRGIVKISKLIDDVKAALQAEQVVLSAATARHEDLTRLWVPETSDDDNNNDDNDKDKDGGAQ